MITIVDTNVLLDVLESDSESADKADLALSRCAEDGDLYLPIVCYAELAPRFVSRRVLDNFLQGLPLTPKEAGQDAAFLAGKLFAEHARKVGRQGRVLADFLVGAQAMVLDARLLTRDSRFYSEAFRGLKAVKPVDF